MLVTFIPEKGYKISPCQYVHQAALDFAVNSACNFNALGASNSSIINSTN